MPNTSRTPYPKYYRPFIGATALDDGFMGLVPQPTIADLGKVLSADGTWVTVSGTGTVTSVAMTVPSIMAVTGSPITGAGTLAVTLATQTANTVFAGPTTGAAAAPTFRSLVAADIPALDAAKITTGTMATSRLGSGTANSTTFLRGDNTWAIPASGGSPGGATTQIQFNNAGAFDGSAGLTWDNTNSILSVASVTANTSTLLGITQTTTVTNAVQEVLAITANSSGIPSANYGAGVGFYLETSTTNSVQAAAIRASWPIATHASRSSAVSIHTVNNAGALSEVIRFGSDGSNNYTAYMSPVNQGGLYISQTHTSGSPTSNFFAFTTLSAGGFLINVGGSMYLLPGVSTTGSFYANYGTIGNGGGTSALTSYKSAGVAGFTSMEGAHALLGETYSSNIVSDNASTLALVSRYDNTSLAATVPMMHVFRTSNAPSAGYGVNTSYVMRTSTNANGVVSGRIDHDWSDPTDATASARFRFYVMNAGSLAEVFVLDGAGIRVGSSSNYVGFAPSGAGTQTYAIPATDGSNGQVLTTNGAGVLSWTSVGGTGTVTSVAMTVPTFLSVAGSPVTTSGTLAVTLATQTANRVFSGPTTGAAAAPTFRALVSDDIPSLDTAKITTGTFNPVFLGSGTPDNTKYLRGDGAWATLPAGTVTTVALTAPSEITVTGSPITTSGTFALTWATQTANTVFSGPSSAGPSTPTFRALVAADIPSLDTAKITTGTMATARLGSGTANSTTYLRGDSTWATLPAGGTVTSVALTAPSEISVAGSPITTSGTLALTWATQTANTVFSGPSSAGPSTPTFRALVAADIPSLDASKITTGTIATARLGSGVADSTTFLRGDSTWATPTTAPGGSTTQIQFNNAGALAGSASNTWDNTNGQLAVSSVTANTNPVLVITQTTTATNTVQEVMRLQSNVSGTPTTNYGLSLGFYGETSTTNSTYMGEINTQWSVTTHASRNSAMVFKAVVSGTTTEVMRLNDSQNGGSSNMTIAATNLVTINATQTISSNGTVSGTITATSTVGATGSHGAVYGTTTLNTGFSTTAAQTGLLGTLTSGTSSSTVTSYISAGVRGTTNHPGAYGLIGQLTQANTATGSGAAILAYISADTNNNSSTLRLVEISRQGGTPAAGYGAGIYFSLSSSTQARDAGLVSYEWSTATDASRTSVLKIATINNAGSLTTRLQINGGGDFAFTQDTSVTNAATTVQTFTLNSTGTAATGFGHQVLFQAESSTTNGRDQAAWQYTWTDATDATRTSGMALLLASSGTMTSFLTITGSAGALNLPQSGQTISIGGTQVLKSRITGWAAWTGTPNRATKDTATATTQDCAQTLMALLQDFFLHGFLGV